jgi:hypothetical protein
MRIFQDFWGVESADWTIDQSPECITLCPASADAALQISCHRKRDGDVTIEELFSFSQERLPREVVAQRVQYGDFEGVYGSFTDSDVFWRNWWLAHGQTLLFVTYNCDDGKRDDHTEIVDRILSTLEAIDA